MDEATMRAAFENWHIHASSVSMTRFGPGHGECGEYVHRFIQSEWLAWRDAVRWATSDTAEKPTIAQQLKAKGYPRTRPKLPNDDDTGVGT